MAKTDEYIDEAYRELQKLSSDERAKLEYEARQKAIRDYNSQMSSALQLGMEKGVKRGISIGEENKLRELIRKKLAKSQTVEEIADILEEDVETVRRLAAEIQSGE